MSNESSYVSREQYLQAKETIIKYLEQIEKEKSEILALPMKKYLRDDGLSYDLITDIDVYKERKSITATGIYFMIDQKGEIQYIGQAINIDRRLKNHEKLRHKTDYSIFYICCSKRDMDLLEQVMINYFRPLLNKDVQILDRNYVEALVLQLCIDLPLFKLIVEEKEVAQKIEDSLMALHEHYETKLWFATNSKKAEAINKLNIDLNSDFFNNELIPRKPKYMSPS